jgi:hypothetical protein
VNIEFPVRWLVYNFWLFRYIHCARKKLALTCALVVQFCLFSVSLIFTCVIILKQLLFSGSVNIGINLDFVLVYIDQYSLRLRRIIVKYSQVSFNGNASSLSCKGFGYLLRWCGELWIAVYYIRVLWEKYMIYCFGYLFFSHLIYSLKINFFMMDSFKALIYFFIS